MTRRLHQCKWCDSLARHQPCLWFYTAPPDSKEFRAVSTLRVCDNHRKMASDYLLSPTNKAQIMSKFEAENLSPVDFSSAEVHFSPLNDGIMIEGSA